MSRKCYTDRLYKMLAHPQLYPIIKHSQPRGAGFTFDHTNGKASTILIDLKGSRGIHLLRWTWLSDHAGEAIDIDTTLHTILKTAKPYGYAEAGRWTLNDLTR